MKKIVLVIMCIACCLSCSMQTNRKSNRELTNELVRKSYEKGWKDGVIRSMTQGFITKSAIKEGFTVDSLKFEQIIIW